ncbi:MULTISPECIES: hypothetical protein [Ramlibacter]|jgi:hypothetical protein|uniref:Uncharacterized protein n=1 Tax=Ramlibacter pinisoli TaxID=2682844 RepID=A0A6N8IZN4_9BURK|nr:MULTISPECIES: hypothetical protein [Ramlibacter]MBA2961520.1 hypothetical protein [Ramlibacter sp. CGMCC 1.13660]MVQ31463.1 hypothetical protein [Ramlibacter pinisoli]
MPIGDQRIAQDEMERLEDCVEPERSSVMASPVFWIAALGSLVFWAVVGLLLIG